MLERIASWSEVQWLGVVIALLAVLWWQELPNTQAVWTWTVIALLSLAASLWVHFEEPSSDTD